jgi:hypothetical protein
VWQEDPEEIPQQSPWASLARLWMVSRATKLDLMKNQILY